MLCESTTLGTNVTFGPNTSWLSILKSAAVPSRSQYGFLGSLLFFVLLRTVKKFPLAMWFEFYDIHGSALWKISASTIFWPIVPVSSKQLELPKISLGIGEISAVSGLKLAKNNVSDVCDILSQIRLTENWTSCHNPGNRGCTPWYQTCTWKQGASSQGPLRTSIMMSRERNVFAS